MIVGALMGVAVGLVAGFINGVLVIRAGGSNQAHAYLVGAGKDITLLHVLLWLVFGVLAGAALRMLYKRWQGGWRPWLATLVIVAAHAVVATPPGTADADDGGWEECQAPGEGADCLLPAFDSSPTISAMIFVGFIAGWIRPTMPRQAWAFARRSVEQQITRRRRDPPESVPSAVITTTAALGRPSVEVREADDGTRTRAVRFVVIPGPARHQVEREPPDEGEDRA